MSRYRWTFVAGATIFAAGCAGAPPSSLVDARKAYKRASESPAQQLAPDQLHAAEVFLKTAEQTYEDEGESANMRDRAYVAMRKAELAEAQAGIVQANMQAQTAEEREQQARQRESAATASQLAETQAELASAREQNAAHSQELQSERERREQAEAAQRQALQALDRVGEVKQEPRGTVLTLSGSVIFASGKSQLLPAARNKLSEVAAALAAGNKDSKIVVEGHTDSVGSSELNRELSLQRAMAVRDELIANGVSPTRLDVQGYGATRPVADNSSQAGRANNRRVEIVVQPMS